eukprot:scaffold7676_cov258-Pinguiococcus_pyrenoidosus.AAC.13
MVMAPEARHLLRTGWELGCRLLGASCRATGPRQWWARRWDQRPAAAPSSARGCTPRHRAERVGLTSRSSALELSGAALPPAARRPTLSLPACAKPRGSVQASHGASPSHLPAASRTDNGRRGEGAQHLRAQAIRHAILRPRTGRSALLLQHGRAKAEAAISEGGFLVAAPRLQRDLVVFHRPVARQRSSPRRRAFIAPQQAFGSSRERSGINCAPDTSPATRQRPWSCSRAGERFRPRRNPTNRCKPGHDCSPLQRCCLPSYSPGGAKTRLRRRSGAAKPLACQKEGT